MGKQAKINEIAKHIAAKQAANGKAQLPPVSEVRDFPPAIRKQFTLITFNIGQLRGQITAQEAQRQALLEQALTQAGIDLTDKSLAGKIGVDYDAGTFTVQGAKSAEAEPVEQVAPTEAVPDAIV